MLTISGLKNFYYLLSFHDMRYKASCVSEIIRSRHHRDPLQGDVYIFISKTKRRLNSLFFCSTKGALRSAVYDTFVEICKQAGISFRSFFCKYMTEIRKGRTHYNNLLPMKICLTN